LVRELSKSVDQELEASALQQQNARLMHLIGDAKRDAEALSRMAAVLVLESRRTDQVLVDYKAKCLELKAKLSQFH
jgi:hypothetical protein